MHLPVDLEPDDWHLVAASLRRRAADLLKDLDVAQASADQAWGPHRIPTAMAELMARGVQDAHLEHDDLLTIAEQVEHHTAAALAEPEGSTHE